MKITCTSTSLNDSIPLAGRSFQRRGKNRYRIQYSEVNTDQEADVQEMFDTFQAQISVSNPYDDAEYAWANIKNGVIRIIKDGKVVAKEFYFNADDEDIENDEWCDTVINRALDALEKVNGKVESRIIHNSTDLDVQYEDDVETDEDEFDKLLEKYTGSSVPSNHVWSEPEFHKFMEDVASSTNIDGYWFFTRHGVQPGSVPKDVEILDMMDTAEGTFVKFNRFLSTKELNYYDMVEKAPEGITSAEDVQDDDVYEDIKEIGQEFTSENTSINSADTIRYV